MGKDSVRDICSEWLHNNIEHRRGCIECFVLVMFSRVLEPSTGIGRRSRSWSGSRVDYLEGRILKKGERHIYTHKLITVRSNLVLHSDDTDEVARAYLAKCDGDDGCE